MMMSLYSRVRRLISLVLLVAVIGGVLPEGLPAAYAEPVRSSDMSGQPIAPSGDQPELASAEASPTSEPTTGPAPEPMRPSPLHFDTQPNPTVAREAFELEDDSTRVFEMTDGTMRTSIRTGPFQAEVAEDVYVPANDSVSRSSDPCSYETIANPADAEFSPTWLENRPVRVSRKGVTVSMGLVQAEDCAPIALDDTVIYPDIANDVTLKYQTRHNGLKETLMLTSPAAATTYSFDVQVQNGRLIPYAAGHAIVGTRGVDPVFFVGALSVFDAADSVCETATADVRTLGNGLYRFTYTVPRAWLASPDRSFPVSVDPEIMVDQDTYVNEATNQSYLTSTNMATGRYIDGRDQDRRALLRFDPSARERRYVHDATFQVYCNYIQCESRTYLAETLQYWNPGNLTFSTAPTPTTPISSKLLPATVGWSYWDVTDLAQRWVRPIDPVSANAHTLQLWQKEEGSGEQSKVHYKKFNSEEAGSYAPEIVWHDELPRVTATPDRDTYTLSGSDVVSVTVSVPTAWPADVRSVRFRVNGADEGERSRGEMRWYSYEPTDSALSVTPCAGGGYVAYVTTDTAYAIPDLTASAYSASTAGGTTTMTVTFAFTARDNWGDTDINSLDTKLLMGQGRDSFETTWQPSGTFSVVPEAVSATSVEATGAGLDWFSSETGDPQLSPDDTKRQGRGFVDLTWDPQVGADGYNIWAHDGNDWRQVGSAFGNDTTSWTSEGKGLYPLDSAINSLTAPSATSGFRGSSPSLASRITSLAAGKRNTAQIVVSDGAWLFARASAESTSWARIGTGLKGTPSGESTAIIGPRLPAASGAFYLDGYLYSGCTSSTGSQLDGIWVNERESQNTSPSTITFSEPLLIASTAAPASVACSDVLVATDGRTIYSVAETIESGHDGWTVRPYQWDGSHREAAMTEDKVIAFPSYPTASVIAEDGFLTFIEDAPTARARVTKVRTDTWTVTGQCALEWPVPGKALGTQRTTAFGFLHPSPARSGRPLPPVWICVMIRASSMPRRQSHLSMSIRRTSSPSPHSTRAAIRRS